jgi:glc operon protein GlcG
MPEPSDDSLPQMLISYRKAIDAIEAAMDYGRAKGVSLSVAVVDSAGHLVAAGRMDGASFITMEIARGKAFASVATGGQPGSALAQRYRDNPMVWGNVAILGYGAPLLPATGSLPIFLGGTLVGAIAASGAPSEIDEAAVLRGIVAIGATLTREGST